MAQPWSPLQPRPPHSLGPGPLLPPPTTSVQVSFPPSAQGALEEGAEAHRRVLSCRYWAQSQPWHPPASQPCSRHHAAGGVHAVRQQGLAALQEGADT